jgi:hypothetical protein
MREKVWLASDILVSPHGTRSGMTRLDEFDDIPTIVP